MEHQQRGDELHVQPQARYLDMRSAREFLACVQEHTTDGTRLVVVDLSCVQFLDSCGMAALVTLRRARPGREALQITGATPSVQQQMRLSRVLPLLEGRGEGSEPNRGRQRAA